MIIITSMNVKSDTIKNLKILQERPYEKTFEQLSILQMFQDCRKNLMFPTKSFFIRLQARPKYESELSVHKRH